MLGFHCCKDVSLVIVGGSSAPASYRGGFSCFGVWAAGGAGFSGSLALGHRLDSFCTGAQLPHGMILPDQGSNPCLLNWQADSLPLSHQGSPGLLVDFPLLDSDL